MQVELSLARTRVPSAQDLDIQVRITNDGGEAVRLNTLFLPMPSVVLRVRDGAGRSVPLGPPPVPPLDDGETGRVLLEPGGSVQLSYAGGRMFGVAPPPGRYAVRFTFEAVNDETTHDWEGLLQSAWVPFEVVGG